MWLISSHFTLQMGSYLIYSACFVPPSRSNFAQPTLNSYILSITLISLSHQCQHCQQYSTISNLFHVQFSFTYTIHNTNLLPPFKIIFVTVSLVPFVLERFSTNSINIYSIEDVVSSHWNEQISMWIRKKWNFLTTTWRMIEKLLINQSAWILVELFKTCWYPGSDA